MQNTNLHKYLDKSPKIGIGSFIAPNAFIVGNVNIGCKSSIWFNSVIRGDVAKIEIGDGTNIQDGTIIHVSRNDGPTFIGSKVTIGHKVLLHACTIEDRSLIGMGSIIMDDAKIETESMVAAGSLVTKGKIIKSGELWGGRPAKFLRKLTEQEIAFIKISADNYIVHAEEYLKIFE